MKPLILILSLFLTLTAFGQQPEYPDSGFTNKVEAKNLMVNGKREGKWCEYFSDDMEDPALDTNNYFSYRLTVYKDGKPTEVVREYRKNDKLVMELPYRNGKANGINKFYYLNGQLEQERPYTNGKLNGEEKMYYENGKLMKVGSYFMGKPTGIQKNYDTNGIIYQESIYKTMDSATVIFFNNGKISGIVPLVKKRISGVRKEYYDNGKLQSEATYRNDTLDGVMKEYYEDGKVWSVTNYKNGVKVTNINYDRNGTKIKQ